MIIKEIEAKTILRKYKKIDSWFLARYGLNLYRGCLHDCVYCDGRTEKYSVQGEFGREIEVKVNAIKILSRELNPHRKRQWIKSGFIILGGGVGDSYQPAEARYKLSRQLLELILAEGYPVHILTKSTLVSRDLDLIKQINQAHKAIVSFSFSSMDEKISRIFEPGVPSPQERLECLKQIKHAGITTGIFLMPVIPFITDTPAKMEESLKLAEQIGADFVIFGGMTLKTGRQKDFFMQTLIQHFPELADKYTQIYSTGSQWGQAVESYYQSINKLFCQIAKKYAIPRRIPLPIFKNQMNENDLAVVILEHIDYLLKQEGQASSFGYAAYILSQLKVPLIQLKEDLPKIKGLNKAAIEVIQEIITTGTARLYKNLMH